MEAIYCVVFSYRFNTIWNDFGSQAIQKAIEKKIITCV